MVIHEEGLWDKMRRAGKGDRCRCFDHPCDAAEPLQGRFGLQFKKVEMKRVSNEEKDAGRSGGEGGLPSNNFISFPPLSRRPAPPLTMGCCFLPERKKGKHRAAWGRLRTQQQLTLS
ncbi:hypothetical protein GOODEAATRI_009966 [Goodea atripinnis]|uniref:Uncharacterized protein n=1 Tax=Goodea atripinnis TaxID=208336 RepID=A0ABV0PCV8_9TELE